MPWPGFIQDAEVQEQVKAVLSVDALDPAGNWPRICQAANRTAYGTILGAFTRRGYSQAQVDGWDRGKEFQLDIALWYAVVRGGLTKDYDTQFISLFDRRGELKAEVLLVNGVLVAPAIPATSTGTEDTDGDLFSLRDEDLQDWYERGEGPLVPPAPRQ